MQEIIESLMIIMLVNFVPNQFVSPCSRLTPRVDNASKAVTLSSINFQAFFLTTEAFDEIAAACHRSNNRTI